MGDIDLSAVIGADATFTCETNSSTLRWSFLPNGQNSEIVRIHNGERANEKYIDKYEVTFNNAGYGTLKVLKVHLYDSGTYKCLKALSGVVSASFNLTVVEEFTTIGSRSSSLLPQLRTTTVTPTMIAKITCIC